MATAVLVGAPLIGWPSVVRLPAVLVPALALGMAAPRPGGWSKADWETLDTWIPTAPRNLFGNPRMLGAGGLLAVTSASAFALNDNTARALNHGFHPEVLYAWYIP